MVTTLTTRCPGRLTGNAKGRPRTEMARMLMATAMLGPRSGGRALRTEPEELHPVLDDLVALGVGEGAGGFPEGPFEAL